MPENKMVSIIVPIYNTAPYLDSCIATLVNQTYTDLQILLIVDGATDGSAEICRKWQKADPRIIVFENENRGVSFSRNFGIEQSTGRYITFVDSDDLIHETYVETLVAIQQDSHADLVAVKAVAFDELHEPEYLIAEAKTVRRGDLYENLFTISNGFVWAKLYDAQCLKTEKIRFDQDIFVCEDLLLNFRYAEHCTTMAFNDSVLYGYRQRAGSAVHNTASVRWFSCLQAYKRLYENYRNTSAFVHIVFYGLKNLYEAKYLLRNKKAKAEWITVDLEEQIRVFEKNRKALSFKQRVKLWICKYLFFVVELRRK